MTLTLIRSKQPRIAILRLYAAMHSRHGRSSRLNPMGGRKFRRMRIALYSFPAGKYFCGSECQVRIQSIQPSLRIG
jgi:hypothetical protein